MALGSESLKECNQGQCTCDKTQSKVLVKSSFLSGSWGGLPLASSLEDLPLEQRLEDALSECWETATLKEPVEVLGFAEVHLELSTDRPCALVAARLCDVLPDGESSLITRGTLTHKGTALPLVKCGVHLASHADVVRASSRFPVGEECVTKCECIVSPTFKLI